MASIGSILYIDPLSFVETSYDGKDFGVETDKHSFIGSRVSYKDIILHSFKVSSTISDDELKSNVEIKMYEYAGLDLQKQYKISYIKKNIELDDTILIEAFAIDTQEIKESLNGVLKRKKHIDFLAVPFLAFSTLYKNKIIAPKNDLFIYIDENEAFLSLYKDGEYLSSKSVMTLEDMAKKIDGAGIKISAEELKNHLASKGLDATLYERGESALYNELETIFATMFTKINDVVVYNRSIFGFEKIDRIFLSMQNGRIVDIKKFMLNFGFTDIEVNDFNIFKDKVESDFFSNIVTSYIYDTLETHDFKHNLTIFKREPAFYKKESGQTILAAVSIVILFLVYIGYVSYENSQLEQHSMLAEQRYAEVKKNEARHQNSVNVVNSELKAAVGQKQHQEDRIKNISMSIKKLENLVDIKKDASSFILKVNSLLAKNSLATTSIELLTKDELSVELIAGQAKRDDIAKFIEDLIENGFISVKTDEIKSDKDVYISKIEIKK
jgi:hypothetical protein